MKNFSQIFRDVERLTADERKPLSAMVSQLFQEGGELAEAASITEGHIRHKTLSEPLVGEVADVCQVAISILVRATPDLSPEERLELFLSHFERKNLKWEGVQADDAHNEAAIRAAAIRRDFDHAEASAVAEEQGGGGGRSISRSLGGSRDIVGRAFQVVSEQLGVSYRDLKMDDNFVEDLGADSLDLVELAMAIEDEFEMEVSDRDAEAISTPGEIVDYINKRFSVGINPKNFSKKDI